LNGRLLHRRRPGGCGGPVDRDRSSPGRRRL